ncbi:MAG: hypothetical protein JW982_01350 [Spirochaetes bacterium]|nr:hypothetical protein [Spirochaetota bacterium]
MNKKIILSIIIVLSAVCSAMSYGANFNDDVLDKIKINDADIPEGFIYGSIPVFARPVLKMNPWALDRSAIDRLAKNIYPDGNSQSIKSIHMTILASNAEPYGDDIVCYLILFKSSDGAKTEVKKLTDYVKYNSDRAILLTKNNLAVFIHTDDTANYDLIADLSGKIQIRMDLEQ